MESKMVDYIPYSFSDSFLVVRALGEDYFTPFLALFGDEFKDRFFTYKIFFRDSPCPMTTVKIIL